jgi:hypothetical protein
VTHQPLLLEAADRPCHALLERGSGGGNNASHIKARFSMVLVDRSPAGATSIRRIGPCPYRNDMKMWCLRSFA